jgi:hypothetical protein
MTLMIFILTITFSHSGEVTGAGGPMKDLLNSHGYTQTFLDANNLKVTLGEVTGAGRVHIDDVQAFVAKNRILSDKDIVKVHYSANGQAQFVNEVKSIEFVKTILKKKQIRAIIHRK